MRAAALRFVQALALLPACGGPQVPAADPATAPSASAASGSASASTVATADEPPADPTAGSGPCRCSWDTNGAAAPRVCKKGEPNYAGSACVPKKSWKGPIKGPLPPPDLPA